MITFEQWAEYEMLRQDEQDDRRVSRWSANVSPMRDLRTTFRTTTCFANGVWTNQAATRSDEVPVGGSSGAPGGGQPAVQGVVATATRATTSASGWAAAPRRTTCEMPPSSRSRCSTKAGRRNVPDRHTAWSIGSSIRRRRSRMAGWSRIPTRCRFGRSLPSTIAPRTRQRLLVSVWDARAAKRRSLCTAWSAVAVPVSARNVRVSRPHRFGARCRRTCCSRSCETARQQALRGGRGVRRR